MVPAPLPVAPATFPVIPAPLPVIPAKAGIHSPAALPALSTDDATGAARVCQNSEDLCRSL